uniref:hypothetical protein n=1 Tax=Streptosporangium sp. CA-235898 TaxID=3240073 RepID=UPI003F4963AE
MTNLSPRDRIVIVLAYAAALLSPPLTVPDVFPGSLAALITAHVLGWILGMITIHTLVNLVNAAEHPLGRPAPSKRILPVLLYAGVSTVLVSKAISDAFDSLPASIIGMVIALAWGLLTTTTIVRLVGKATRAAAKPHIPEGCDAYTPLTGLTAPREIPIPGVRFRRRDRSFTLGEEILVGDEHGNRATARVLGTLGNVYGGRPASPGLLVNLTSIDHAPSQAPAAAKPTESAKASR